MSDAFVFLLPLILMMSFACFLQAQPPLASTTKGSLVKPLSPRSENVISPTTRSLKGTPQSIGNVQANQTNASQLKTPEQKSDPLDELLDGMSPTSFYKKTTPARALGSRSSQSGVLEAAGDIFVGTTQNQTVVSPKVSHKSTPGKMGKVCLHNLFLIVCMHLYTLYIPSYKCNFIFRPGSRLQTSSIFKVVYNSGFCINGPFLSPTAALKFYT